MKKKLKIAQIAPLWVPIPPKKYGGIERIVHYLTEELVRRGHDVTLFASGDSKTKAKLVSVYPRSLLKDNIDWANPKWNLENLSAVFSRAKDFDVLHSHLDVWTLFFQKMINTPVLHTFHNPFHTEAKSYKNFPERMKIFYLYRKTTNAVFVSKSQRKVCPIKFPKNWICYNGIDTSLYKFNPKPKDYFIWVARIDKCKGIENAILAAKKAGVKLLLAGRLDSTQEIYFKTKIKPHLGRQIKYVGELAQKEIAEFYAKAKGCLYPIEWEEPFGLVMTESMSCGTPVIAFNNGSVPEVVKDKKTGFVIPFKDKRGRKNIKALVEAIKKIDEIKREDCRNWVEENFSYPKMVDYYEQIYYRLAKG